MILKKSPSAHLISEYLPLNFDLVFFVYFPKFLTLMTAMGKNQETKILYLITFLLHLALMLKLLNY